MSASDEKSPAPIKILLKKSPDYSFTLYRGSQKSEWTLSSQPHFQTPEFFLNWLLSCSRRFLFEDLPAHDLEIGADQDWQNSINEMSALNKFADLLESTNRWTDENKNLKNIAHSYEKILFYGPSTEGFEQLYDEMKGPRVSFESYDSGWDHLTREWRGSNAKDPETFIRQLLDSQIRRVVSTNMYYPLHCLGKNILLLPILKFLGISFHAVDFDFYDLAFNLSKAALHCDSFERFSMHRHLQKEWDDLYDLKNIFYTPSTFISKTVKKETPLQDDFKLAVFSNSRLKDSFLGIDQSLKAFELSSEDNLYDDFQLWYYACRRLIVRDLALDLGVRDWLNRRLYVVFLGGLTLLKYETLHHLTATGRVEIYGDQAWSEIFPESYTGKYLTKAQTREMLSKGEHLTVLMNANFSYLENNPVFQRALDFNSAFCMTPAFLSLPKFEKLKALEYRSPTQLLRSLSEIRELWNEGGCRENLTACRELLHSSNESFQKFLESGLRQKSQYEDVCERSSSLTENRLEAALQDRRAEFVEFVEQLKRGQFWDLKKSRYWGRSYLQRIIQNFPNLTRQDLPSSFTGSW